MTKLLDISLVAIFATIFAGAAVQAAAGEGQNIEREITVGEVAPRVRLGGEVARRLAEVSDALDVRAASLQELRFVRRNGNELRTAVVVDGATWTLDLQKLSIRSRDFQAFVDDGSGVLTAVEPPPSQTYVGSVAELPDSEVRAVFDGESLDAVIHTAGGMYGVQPLARAGLIGLVGEHAVFHNSDWVNRRGFTCAEDAGLQVFDGAAGIDSAVEPSPVAGAAYKVAQIALDADFEFFQQNGSSIDAAILDMENIINGMQTIYETQLNITYEISHVIVRSTSATPYTSTSPSTLLNQLVSHWNASPQSAIPRDLVHLFTGKNLDGSTIGIAYIGAVCRLNSAYGLSQSRFTSSMPARVALTAHEVGHNWNAQHCNSCTGCTDCCRIMCSGLGGCSGIVTSFGCFELGQISAFRDTRTCLHEVADDECFTHADCDDGQFCNGAESCVGGECQPAPTGGTGGVVNGAFDGSSGWTSNVPSGGTITYSGNLRVVGPNAGARAFAWAGQGAVTFSGANLQFDLLSYSSGDTGAYDYPVFFLNGTYYGLNSNGTLGPVSTGTTAGAGTIRNSAQVTSPVQFVVDVNALAGHSGPHTIGFGVASSDGAYGAGTAVFDNVAPPAGSGGGICPGQVCNETTNSCVDCLSNAHCSDGQFCNGVETCVAGVCQPAQGGGVANGGFDGSAAWTMSAPSGGTITFPANLRVVGPNSSVRAFAWAGQSGVVLNGASLQFDLISYASGDAGAYDYPVFYLNGTFRGLNLDGTVGPVSTGTTSGAGTIRNSAQVTVPIRFVVDVNALAGHAGPHTIGFGVASADGRFGAGTAVFDNVGPPQSGSLPCTGQTCDEVNDRCLP